MRLLYSIILVLLGTVDRLRNQFPISDTITTQLVCHDLPRLTTMTSQKSLEEALCCRTIPSCLQKYVNNLTVLINSTP